MVKLTDFDGRLLFIEEWQIAKIVRAIGDDDVPTSVRAVLQTLDGETLAVRETVQQIVMRMAEARK